MIAIGLGAGGGAPGLQAIYGACIVAGIFAFLVAPFFAKLVRFFPPVVTGTVIRSSGWCCSRWRPRRGRRARRRPATSAAAKNLA